MTSAFYLLLQCHLPHTTVADVLLLKALCKCSNDKISVSGMGCCLLPQLVYSCNPIEGPSMHSDHLTGLSWTYLLQFSPLTPLCHLIDYAWWYLRHWCGVFKFPVRGWLVEFHAGGLGPILWDDNIWDSVRVSWSVFCNTPPVLLQWCLHPHQVRAISRYNIPWSGSDTGP